MAFIRNPKQPLSESGLNADCRINNRLNARPVFAFNPENPDSDSCILAPWPISTPKWYAVTT